MKLAEWQAILAGYGILLVVTEAGAGQIAVISAWGIALVYLADTLSGGSSVLSGLFPTQPAPPQIQVPSGTIGSSGIPSGTNPIFPSPGGGYGSPSVLTP